jgi:hypothetical protein
MVEEMNARDDLLITIDEQGNTQEYRRGKRAEDDPRPADIEITTRGAELLLRPLRDQLESSVRLLIIKLIREEGRTQRISHFEYVRIGS